MEANTEESNPVAYLKWKGWLDKQPFAQCDRAAAAYYSAELSRSRINLNSHTAVLEIGFGNGEFAAYCKSKGCNYIGTEISDELVAAGRAKGFKVQHATDGFAGLGPFDLVVAFDVFEHLEITDLRLLLSKLASSLSPDGVILARLPSGDSPFARPIQHGDLTHRTTLGSSALRQLAPQVKLQFIEAREPAFLHRGIPLPELHSAANGGGSEAGKFPHHARRFLFRCSSYSDSESRRHSGKKAK